MSLGGGKSTTKQSSQQQQQAAGTQSFTPGNLDQLKVGWNIADQLLGQNAPAGNNAVGQGLNLTQTGANAASGAATSGLSAALGFGNGGTANDANQYLTPFANGSMSGNNPNFQSMVDLLSKSLQPQIDGSFAASGRYGSGANANAFADALTKESGNLAYQNYGDSLNRQLQAGGQLSANNTNATGQSINALDLINGLGSTATGAGGALSAAGYGPSTTFAQILQALGQGGGTGTTSSTGSGTATGKSNTSEMGFKASLGGSGGILSMFGL
jgi:hypothetical protein